jgi:hypothetical protein
MSVESQNTTLWSASIFEGMNARIHKRQIDTLTFLALQARQPLRDLVCLRSLGLLGWKTNCRDWVNMTTGHGACMRDVIVVIQVHCQCVGKSSNIVIYCHQSTTQTSACQECSCLSCDNLVSSARIRVGFLFGHVGAM